MYKLKAEIEEELLSILNFWSEEMVDETNGGFLGEIDFQNHKNLDAEKGSVLNGRILWTFSTAYPYTKNTQHKDLAKRAFDYIKTYFYNNKKEGIYWSVNADGSPKDTKNQIYSLAFVIYGLSEYFKISKDQEALDLAIKLYHSIQKYSYDPINKGYFEAYTSDWQEIEDMRLSEKDANEKKTMNTHLHIVEGFANLFTVWKDETLRKTIIELLEVIEAKFINKETWNLRLFFDENWIEKPDVISFGHDIEAAWLLQWCAETTEEKELIERYKTYAVKIAEVTKKGIDLKDGGLWYEFDPITSEFVAEKHWWPQAELWIGYVNAWQLSGNEEYLDIVQKNWEFVKSYIIDKKNGEWFWGVDDHYDLMHKDKAGFWKCPYHNGRACLELIKRIA